MTPSEFQILTARCDRMQREIDDLRALVGSPDDLIRAVAPIGHSRECSCDEPGCNVCNPNAASLSDVLRASVEKESKERTTINECSHGTPPERWVTIRDTTIVDDVERPTESEARDPDVSFLRELADLLDAGDAEYIGRHVPKRLNEIAAKIAYHQKPATPKRATNVKGV